MSDDPHYDQLQNAMARLQAASDLSTMHHRMTGDEAQVHQAQFRLARHAEAMRHYDNGLNPQTPAAGGGWGMQAPPVQEQTYGSVHP